MCVKFLEPEKAVEIEALLSGSLQDLPQVNAIPGQLVCQKVTSLFRDPDAKMAG